jgi:hypothetical protein
MDITKIIILLFIVIVAGCVIKYIRGLLNSENAQSTRNGASLNSTDNSSSTINILFPQSVQDSYVLSVAQVIANIIPQNITTTIANEITKTNAINNKNNQIINSSLNNQMASFMNTTILPNSLNSSFIADSSLPWDSDPVLKNEVCDFNVENRSGNLENIIVY